QFSAKEQSLLVELMKQAKKVTIALTLDKPYTTELPDKLSLFFMTGRTYHRIYNAARGAGVKIQFDTVLKIPARIHCSEINLLEDYWVESNDPHQNHLYQFPIKMDGCLTVW